MKPKKPNAMTNSSAITRRTQSPALRGTVSLVLNLLGVIAGFTTALLALTAWCNPTVFFSSLAVGLFCLDPVRQSW